MKSVACPSMSPQEPLSQITVKVKARMVFQVIIGMNPDNSLEVFRL